jgi:predicted RNA-binding protein YlxR (DUF448 family)
LLRIAAVSDGAGARARAVLDLQARMPGRGAYLCREGSATQRPATACLAQAARRGAIARALRRAIAGDLVSDDAKLVESMGS